MPSNSERHQHLDRTQIELFDNHGRMWRVESEVGMDSKRRPRLAVVGTFTPAFKAPHDFYPPQEHLVYDPRRPSVLVINYQGWISNIKRAHQDVRQQIVHLATKLYKTQAAKYIKEPTEEMLELIYGGGKGPEPVEPAIAAMQGNGWILGLRGYDSKLPGDKKLKPFLDQWVAARRYDARLEEEEELSKYDFTEGQESDELAEEGLEV
jgi:hypothetical protein